MFAVMNRCARLAFVSLLLAAPAGAQQQPAPRARRAPPPRRAERIQNLRKLSGQLIEAFAIDPEFQPKPLDVLKINDGLALLLEPLLAQQRGLESFQIGLDPKETKLADDTAKAFVRARFARTTWSPEPSQLDFDVLIKVERISGGPPQANFDGDLVVKTDVIGLANYMKERSVAKAAGQSPARSRPTVNDLFQAHAAEWLAPRPPVASMDDLVDLFTGLAAIRLLAVSEQIDRLQYDASLATDAAAREPLAAALAKARLERDRMFNLRPNVSRDDEGRATALRFTLADAPLDDATHADDMEIVVTAREIRAALTGTIVRGMETYAIVKPLVWNTLERLQSRDPDTLRWGRGVLGDALGKARPYLFVEPQP